jgi:hypothetical protein
MLTRYARIMHKALAAYRDKAILDGEEIARLRAQLRRRKGKSAPALDARPTSRVIAKIEANLAELKQLLKR